MSSEDSPFRDGGASQGQRRRMGEFVGGGVCAGAGDEATVSPGDRALQQPNKGRRRARSCSRSPSTAAGRAGAASRRRLSSLNWQFGPGRCCRRSGSLTGDVRFGPGAWQEAQTLHAARPPSWASALGRVKFYRRLRSHGVGFGPAGGGGGWGPGTVGAVNSL